MTTAWAIQSLTQDIQYENIVLKNGLYINSETGDILDGCYKQKSAWDGFGKGETCIKLNFEQGHRTGKWMETHRGQLIHKGEYLKLKNIQNPILLNTESKSVAFNLWQEGHFTTLNIELIEPKQADSNTMISIVKWVEQSCKKQYTYGSIAIRKLSEDKTEVLFSHDLVSAKYKSDGIPQGH